MKIPVLQMLIRPLRAGINGDFLGFDMDMGKTTISWIYIRIRALILQKYRDIKAEWKERFTGEHQYHSKMGQHPNDMCPSTQPKAFQDEKQKVFERASNGIRNVVLAKETSQRPV